VFTKHSSNCFRFCDYFCLRLEGKLLLSLETSGVAT
jgi:hypothetical protein